MKEDISITGIIKRHTPIVDTRYRTRLATPHDVRKAIQDTAKICALMVEAHDEAHVQIGRAMAKRIIEHFVKPSIVKMEDGFLLCGHCQNSAYTSELCTIPECPLNFMDSIYVPTETPKEESPIMKRVWCSLVKAVRP